MFQLLVRLFIKDYEQVDQPKVRTAYGTLSSLVGICINVMLFAGKLFAGLITGSVSIQADAFNNLSDASSSIISMIGFKLAEKPADSEHPYGHARYEYLSGLIVSMLILLIGVELLKSSFEKVIHPQPVTFETAAVVILLISIVFKLWMAYYNHKTGKLIGSDTLKATAADSRNDVITTAAILASAVVSEVFELPLDGYVGLLVSGFIIYNGFSLIKETSSPLLGKAPDKEHVLEIKHKIMSYPGVLGTHDLMIHDYGPGRLFGSVHVEMAAEQDPLESHEVIDTIERDFLEEEKMHLVVHYDPIATTGDGVPKFRAWLAEEIKQIHPQMTVHDLRMVIGKEQTNVIFDCVIPMGVKMNHREVREKVAALVQKTYPNYHCVITVDESFAPVSHH